MPCILGGDILGGRAARLGLVYLVLSRSLDLASEQEAIRASERELQTIDVATEAVRDGE
jgi:hypothetical protein